MCAFCIPVPLPGTARQVVLLTIPKSSHPAQLLSRQHPAPVSPLPAALTDLPACIANKRLTPKLNPLGPTLTKKPGVGVAPQLSTFLHSNVQRCNSFSVTSLAAPHPATSMESHPYKNHGGGGAATFQPANLPSFQRLSTPLPSSPCLFPSNVFYLSRTGLGQSRESQVSIHHSLISGPRSLFAGHCSRITVHRSHGHRPQPRQSP